MGPVTTNPELQLQFISDPLFTPGDVFRRHGADHAQAIVACDFFTVVTVRFRILYVFVVMELGRRQILHCAGN
jgi:hypothetical protein